MHVYNHSTFSTRNANLRSTKFKQVHCEQYLFHVAQDHRQNAIVSDFPLFLPKIISEQIPNTISIPFLHWLFRTWIHWGNWRTSNDSPTEDLCWQKLWDQQRCYLCLMYTPVNTAKGTPLLKRYTCQHRPSSVYLHHTQPSQVLASLMEWKNMQQTPEVPRI